MSETESGVKLVFCQLFLLASLVVNLQVSLVHQQVSFVVNQRVSLVVNQGVSLEVHL